MKKTNEENADDAKWILSLLKKFPTHLTPEQSRLYRRRAWADLIVEAALKSQDVREAITKFYKFPEPLSLKEVESANNFLKSITPDTCTLGREPEKK